MIFDLGVGLLYLSNHISQHYNPIWRPFKDTCHAWRPDTGKTHPFKSLAPKAAGQRFCEQFKEAAMKWIPPKAAGSGQKPQPQQWSASQWGVSTHGLYLDPCCTRKKRKLFASCSCRRASCSSFPQSNTEHSALLFTHTHPEAPGKAEMAQTTRSYSIRLVQKQCAPQLGNGWRR